MGEGPTPVIVFAPFSPCGRRVGDEGFVNGFGSWHGWRRAGREGWALDRVSPALRAWASDFSLRGQRKVTKRKATPANPLASPVPSGQSQRRTGRRRRHFGLRHPWLRPKPASNILVLAPNRGRAVLALTRFGPCPLRLRHHP